MHLDYGERGTPWPSDSRKWVPDGEVEKEVTAEEAMTPDVVAYLEEHGIQAALERAIKAPDKSRFLGMWILGELRSVRAWHGHSEPHIL